MNVYLSGCHRHSSRCHSHYFGSSGHSDSPQHGEQNHGDRSDTDQVWDQCSGDTSRDMVHRFPTVVQKLLIIALWQKKIEDVFVFTLKFEIVVTHHHELG